MKKGFKKLFCFVISIILVALTGCGSSTGSSQHDLKTDAQGFPLNIARIAEQGYSLDDTQTKNITIKDKQSFDVYLPKYITGRVWDFKNDKGVSIKKNKDIASKKAQKDMEGSSDTWQHFTVSLEDDQDSGDVTFERHLIDQNKAEVQVILHIK